MKPKYFVAAVVLAAGTAAHSEADSKSSSKTNVGAIVGGVVGGVLGAGLLAGLLFVLCRRRKNQSDQIEEPFVVDATEDVVTPYKMEVGESTLSNKGYASVVTYEPQDPPGDEPSSTTYPTSSQDSSTMKQEVRTQQNIVTIDPNEPMHEDTARALLAAIHRQHSTVGVNQEQDAGPVGTAIPPSYNPGWAQRQSESSGLGVASPSSGMSDSASPPKPLSKS
ncbi:hypothetical protein CspHIS471_0502710 [Cutaneotrichosporon sp. HIS471]|nr:hypothetical protein CspHIS471_0502710 [Cutaneotrichosporon sp. HIS471]